MDIRFQVQAKILKPVAEVFDGVYNPKKLSGYFTKEAEGPLDEGTTVQWEFAEVPGKFPVWVKKVVPDKLIVLEWPSAEDASRRNRVEMSFELLDPNSTLVKIKESGWSETQKGLDLSYGNCMGWSQMLACLKAYLEYRINLRKGFYDPAHLGSEYHDVKPKA